MPAEAVVAAYAPDAAALPRPATRSRLTGDPACRRCTASVARQVPVRPGRIIQHMMNNAVEVRDLVVVRGGREVLRRPRPHHRAGRGDRPARPVAAAASRTLMRALVGVQRLTGGSVQVARRARPAARALRDRVGYVTQAASVYDDLTVAREPRASSPACSASTRGAVDAAIERGRPRPTTPTRSSAGSQRRPAVPGQPRRRPARQPRPAGPRRADRRASTRCCAATCGRCSTGSPTAARRCFVSSHVMDEADRCDRLLLMREGRIIADDTPDADPRDRPAPTTSRARSWPWSSRRRRERGMNAPDHCSPSPRRVLTQLRRDHRTAGDAAGAARAC